MIPAPSCPLSPSLAGAPIGVFDSGVGGLSVLQALRNELPHERFVYFSDNAWAPYGERSAAFIAERSLAIATHLLEQHGIKALVVACNTATAAAIELLRQQLPHLQLVGIEPAIKPAAQRSHTGRVGVMGTRGTLGSARFARLLASLPPQVQCVLQPCDGLALAIEQAALQPHDEAARAAVQALCQRYTQAMGRFGRQAGEIDTLVLGCTHYVFAQEHLRALVGPDVQLLDTGVPVARHTRRLLLYAQLLATPSPPYAHDEAQAPCVQWLTSGNPLVLRSAVAHWLHLPTAACQRIMLPPPALDAP